MVRKKGVLRGETYGEVKWALVEVDSPGSVQDSPLLASYFQDSGRALLQEHEMRGIQKGLGRRAFFWIPICPQGFEDHYTGAASTRRGRLDSCRGTSTMRS